MYKLLVIVSALMLLASGCSTKSVPRQCPIPPVYLNQAPEPHLPLLVGGTTQDILQNRKESVKAYSVLRIRYEALRSFAFDEAINPHQ